MSTLTTHTLTWITAAVSRSGKLSFSGVICQTQNAKLIVALKYILKQYYFLCKSILTAPTFFRAAVMDIAALDWGVGAGRAGDLAARSC